ncbi:hypothetical protein WQE_35275 [Paraburkholderia hospita]|uniref:Uncharacterized protein n=1 Tax=Paraburkholderia hospita TaxID=169430 RepID=A0AAN1MKS6_9BURK|nr:hypothetical protein C2L64_20350 [Paraburkholderia hospita]EIM96210.1 hypothetical protein WQE_35275 [Paraburkholderia hospita]OUL73245.1 hypothetical protein CA601_44290 [Paraburkholderia hospita]OUL77747.1 hypothetical protein CA602_32775 [Paraburkholderia hospita]SEI27731.1 hypothetical protein SAMN05192544_10967 [Paraburkholderia hospita]
MRVIVALVAFLTSGLAWAGYDVHITRKAFWGDTSGTRITLDQWKRTSKPTRKWRMILRTDRRF